MLPHKLARLLVARRRTVTATVAVSLALLTVLTATPASAKTAADVSPSSSSLPPSLPHRSWNGLALTPPMGFDTWQNYGTNNTQQDIVDAANMLVSTGLAKLGYNYVVVSEGWNTTYRDANGNLVADPDPTKFPKGIKWLANYVHSRGLKFGIYEDVGTMTCAGRAGMYGHYQQDMNQFASWGVDYLWEDGCNVPYDSYPEQTRAQVANKLWGQVAQAIRNTGRRIVNEDSAPADFLNYRTNEPEPGYEQVMARVAQYGNTFRIGSDIRDDWGSIVRNYQQDNAPNLASYAGPGHWSSPDFLLVGNQTAEQAGLTSTQEQSQLSLWAELASPLWFSVDPKHLSSDALRILSNKSVIAIDQDPLGAQGTIVQSGTNYDVLAKPLANGDVSVALFNRGSTPISIATTARTVGLRRSDEYVLDDLWTKKSTVSTNRIAATVEPGQVVLYRVSTDKGVKGGVKVGQ